jgi:DNA repair protein RadC
VELLAVLLGKGIIGRDALELSADIMAYLAESDSPQPEFSGLCAIKGVGPARAALVLACWELSRRFLPTRSKVVIRKPEDALPYLCELRSSPVEKFVVMTLDGAHQVIRAHVITQGLVNQSPIHPREALRPALEDRAVGLILAHNHPSGSLEPSREDLLATRKLSDAAQILGIPILDHLILSASGFVSLKSRHPEVFN